MDSLFGDGTPTAVKFLVAFAVVFALIAVTAWLIRRFGTGALGGTGARGRAPRLAVIEAGAVDGRRKLVLIRRDNTEHLIMIGGPTDIVVEANIVRGQSTRENAVSRPSSVTEALPRTPSVEESAWPLQPEVTPRPGRAARPAPIEDTTHWALPSEPAAPTMPATPAAPPKRSRSAETLAGLAAELSVRPSEPAAPAPSPRPTPALETLRAKAPPAPAPAAPSASDQNLADMASRLEAALRRPAPAPAAAPPPRPAPAPKPAAETPRAAPPVAPPSAPPVAKEPALPAAPPKATAVTIESEAKPAADKPAKPDDVFGSIEEEMANLLGRPTGKPS
jgi:flagellar biogenesis protein FliO